MASYYDYIWIDILVGWLHLNPFIYNYFLVLCQYFLVYLLSQLDTHITVTVMYFTNFVFCYISSVGGLPFGNPSNICIY